MSDRRDESIEQKPTKESPDVEVKVKSRQDADMENDHNHTKPDEDNEGQHNPKASSFEDDLENDIVKSPRPPQDQRTSPPALKPNVHQQILTAKSTPPGFERSIRRDPVPKNADDSVQRKPVWNQDVGRSMGRDISERTAGRATRSQKQQGAVNPKSTSAPQNGHGTSGSLGRSPRGSSVPTRMDSRPKSKRYGKSHTGLDSKATTGPDLVEEVEEAAPSDGIEREIDATLAMNEEESGGPDAAIEEEDEPKDAEQQPSDYALKENASGTDQSSQASTNLPGMEKVDSNARPSSVGDVVILQTTPSFHITTDSRNDWLYGHHAREKTPAQHDEIPGAHSKEIDQTANGLDLNKTKYTLSQLQGDGVHHKEVCCEELVKAQRSIGDLQDQLCDREEELLWARERTQTLKSTYDETYKEAVKNVTEGMSTGQARDEQARNEQLSAQLDECKQALLKAERERDQKFVDRALETDDTTPWKPVFDHQRAKFQFIEAKYNKLRSEIEKLYQGWPEVERENYELRREKRKLREQLLRYRDRGERLADEAARYKESAAQWKAESKAAQELSARRHELLVESEERERDKGLLIIQEYQQRMPEVDPGWWDMEGLREKVRDGEKQLRASENVLQTVKDGIKKVRLEKEMALKTVETLRKELEEKDGNIGMGQLPSPPESNIEDKASSPAVKETSQTPRSEHPVTKENRGEEMAEFRARQSLVRQEQRKAQDMMEQVRRWKMGPYWPPQQDEWEQVLEKPRWDRWEGDRWLEEAATADKAEQADTLKPMLLAKVMMVV